ncbi:hypothetical protein [Rhodalgimonas zhirmunskyi]|uniref:Uncharacterized protein n=1 Tax=Rhodalgimonas zhirmunskyi TaxID=2964767 RepID=A0AAJ1UAG5_9RHOB|nr:hypothetical protein [Rhodoalgimonas zhirmunskyi]MDQ2095924.1 hypothetical protein [Rhodoalgimonas zhirmunskyi]
MSDLILTKTRLREGVWEGTLHRVKEESHADLPQVEVTLEDRPIEGVELIADQQGGYTLRVPIPVRLINDGVQTFLIRDKAADETLDHFTLIAGEGVENDIRAEIELLRAELDMLKRAFRRHCLDTM